MGGSALIRASRELGHWRSLLDAGETDRVITGVRDLLASRSLPLVIQVEGQMLLARAYAAAGEVSQAEKQISEMQRLLKNTRHPRLMRLIHDTHREIRLAALRGTPQGNGY